MNNGEIIKFIKQKDYLMLNNNLGSGSFGETVLLQDLSIDEVFVAKKYEPYDDDDKKEFYDSFVQEIKIMHKLFHINIVRIYNYYLYPEMYTGYIIMEHIDGSSIDEYFKEWSWLWSAEEVDKIFLQLLDAFNFLEQNGILHRDIRESNILIGKEGRVKLIDFGLGKIIHPIGKSTDSKDGIINRYNMAKHPKEFSDRKYTHQTDMFCIAELFERLLSDNNITEFSYLKCLEKMTKSNPKDRYNSFQEIIDSINTKQFELLSVSEEDKAIYQKFSNAVKSGIIHYAEKPKFETDIDKIIKKLNQLIKENSLENYIQLKNNLISIFVLCGYTYNNRQDVECETIIDFYKWFLSLSKPYQKIVIDNITIKLSAIEVKEPEADLPF